ncbi:ATP-binding cassette domain-containing protein, partial [Actinotalea ferrariae]|uniref:ATP-binding cassette domain-containing protein n=1 Tax=Actinotalea ferrariae TaxID=1386098 RepID=UPI001C8CA53E
PMTVSWAGAHRPGAASAARRGAHATGEPVLRVREGGWEQGGRTVVRVPALDLRPGQVTAMVGCNGSGKSSLLLGLAGLLPGEGQAAARGAGHGAERVDLPPALVLQRPEHQLLTRTVADEVAYGLRLRGGARRGLGRRRARRDGAPDDADVAATVADALDRFSLARLAAADPFRLSGGEQRRLTIAAMAVLGRPALLLDEPTCGLDDVQATAVLALLDELAARGTAVVVATHDLGLARAFADQVLVLREGDVVVVGPPALLDDVGLLRDAGLLVEEARPLVEDAPSAVVAGSPSMREPARVLGGGG